MEGRERERSGERIGGGIKKGVLTFPQLAERGGGGENKFGRVNRESPKLSL